MEPGRRKVTLMALTELLAVPQVHQNAVLVGNIIIAAEALIKDEVCFAPPLPLLMLMAFVGGWPWPGLGSAPRRRRD